MKKPGPFAIVELDGNGDVVSPIEPPRRNFGCNNYETCLAMAAALSWDSFTCRGCSGSVDEKLLWRARSAARTDSSIKVLCQLPEPVTVTQSTTTSSNNDSAEAERLDESNEGETPLFPLHLFYR